ncbi:hypothetical protein WMY93_024935 [Mugilogobius chulae]|uniref:Uncharacterized protein n=1 Tax=Mugilogobius chulae TaxID=88201 RepID=A0AAW0N0Y7_9GOBI
MPTEATVSVSVSLPGSLCVPGRMREAADVGTDVQHEPLRDRSMGALRSSYKYIPHSASVSGVNEGSSPEPTARCSVYTHISVSLPGEMFQAPTGCPDRNSLTRRNCLWTRNCLDQEELSLDQENVSAGTVSGPPWKSGQLFSDYCFSPRLSPRQVEENMIMSLWSGQEKMKVMFCGQNGSKIQYQSIRFSTLPTNNMCDGV